MDAAGCTGEHPGFLRLEHTLYHCAKLFGMHLQLLFCCATSVGTSTGTGMGAGAVGVVGRSTRARPGVMSACRVFCVRLCGVPLRVYPDVVDLAVQL